MTLDLLNQSFQSAHEALLEAAERAGVHAEFRKAISSLVVELQSPQFNSTCHPSELISLCYELKRLFASTEPDLVTRSSAYTKLEDALQFWHIENAPRSTWSGFKKAVFYTTGITGAFGGFDLDQRVKIVCQILKMVRRPQSISQGTFYTCNVTVIQNRLFTLRPALAASLIADVVNNNCFVSWSQWPVLMPNALLEPDQEAAQDEVDGRRNLASMIFQRTAVNVFWQLETMTPAGEETERGEIVYHQANSSKDSARERLLNIGHRPAQSLLFNDGRLVDSPFLHMERIIWIYSQLTHKPAPSTLYLTAWNPSPSRGVVLIKSVEDLHKTLRLIRRNRDFPVFVDLGPTHVVIIRDYDEENRLAAFDNSYSVRHDFLGEPSGSPMKPVRDLFAEMGGPKKHSLR